LSGDASSKVDSFLAFAGPGGPSQRGDLRRGEVYVIRYDMPARRIMIVSSDDLNAANRDFVKVVMITNTAPPPGAERFSVAVATLHDAGELTGFIMCDSLTSLPRGYFDGLTRLHVFRGDDSEKIDAALKASLGIPQSGTAF
jgi:mRNA-degrading endonuclease toxin of MazEF toxin-antitoxin module